MLRPSNLETGGTVIGENSALVARVASATSNAAATGAVRSSSAWSPSKSSSSMSCGDDATSLAKTLSSSITESSNDTAVPVEEMSGRERPDADRSASRKSALLMELATSFVGRSSADLPTPPRGGLGMVSSINRLTVVEDVGFSVTKKSVYR